MVICWELKTAMEMKALSLLYKLPYYIYYIYLLLKGNFLCLENQLQSNL